MDRYELQTEMMNILKLMGTLDPTSPEYAAASDNLVKLQRLIRDLDIADIEKLKADREFELKKEQNENERFKSKVAASSSTKDLVGTVAKTIAAVGAGIVGIVMVSEAEESSILSKNVMSMIRNWFPKIG